MEIKEFLILVKSKLVCLENFTRASIKNKTTLTGMSLPNSQTPPSQSDPGVLAYQANLHRAFLQSAMAQNFQIQQQLLAQNQALQQLLQQQSQTVSSTPCCYYITNHDMEMVLFKKGTIWLYSIKSTG